MNMTTLRSLLTVTLTALGLQACCAEPLGRGPSDPSMAAVPLGSREVTAEIDRVLWWLPEDTETVVISTGRVPVGHARRLYPSPTTTGKPGPLVKSMFADTFRDPPYRYEDIVAAACISPLVGFSALYPPESWAGMVRAFYGPENTVVFAKAMRPTPQGSTEACDIVVFKDDTPERLLRALRRFRGTVGRIEGVPVLDVEVNDLAPDYKGALEPNRRYIASPLPGVYLAATRKQLMQTLVQRMKHRGKSRALPAGLPEWQQVDLSAPAWAIRHYQELGVAKSATSMIKWDPNARGLVFFCGIKPAPFAALRYVSTSADAGKRFVHMQSQWLGVAPAKVDAIPPLPRISAHAVEERRRTNVPTEDANHDHNAMSEEQTNASVSVYLALLGFGPDD